MHVFLWWWLALGQGAAPAADRHAQAGEGDARVGQQRSREELCQECHGEDGNSDSVTVPRLAGFAAPYIVKQLQDFQSGARKHVVMSVMAADLDERTRVDIAAYFSGQPRVRVPESQGSERGRRLFVEGDVERGIPQCAGCHGLGGEGQRQAGVTAPALRWQHRVYLRIQLVGWRLGERANSPGGVMGRVARALTDDDVDALVDFLSGSDAAPLQTSHAGHEAASGAP